MGKANAQIVTYKVAIRNAAMALLMCNLPPDLSRLEYGPLVYFIVETLGNKAPLNTENRRFACVADDIRTQYANLIRVNNAQE